MLLQCFGIGFDAALLYIVFRAAQTREAFDDSSRHIMLSIPLLQSVVGDLDQAMCDGTVVEYEHFLSNTIVFPLRKDEGPDPVVYTTDHKTIQRNDELVTVLSERGMIQELT